MSTDLLPLKTDKDVLKNCCRNAPDSAQVFPNESGNVQDDQDAKNHKYHMSFDGKKKKKKIKKHLLSVML